VIQLASNQVEARNRARDAYNAAEKAGTTGTTLAQLKADFDAKQTIVESATGGSGSGGILS
jgi:hypothetical protein